MKSDMKNQTGMAALLTIVIVGMATLTMVITSSLLGMDQLEMSYSRDKGREAFYLAESCLSDCLRKIKMNPGSLPYSYTLPADNGFCIINMLDNNTISAVGQVENHTKRLRISIAVNGKKITVTDWREE